jgi:hypothetical protein
VIGVVLAKAGETFRVDIGTRHAEQESVIIREFKLDNVRYGIYLLWVDI